jgi:hypothetical protein
VTRRERSLCAAAGIVPTTVAGLALLRCGCASLAWAVEIATATAYFAWIVLG